MVKKKIALIFSTVIDLSIDDDYFKIIPLPLFEKKTRLLFLSVTLKTWGETVIESVQIGISVDTPHKKGQFTQIIYKRYIYIYIYIFLDNTSGIKACR